MKNHYLTMLWLFTITHCFLFVNFGTSLSAQSHTFSTFSPGTLTSGTSGVSTAMATGSLTADYLIYTIEADFVGTGGAQAAWSNSIQLELNDGGTTIFKSLSNASAGSMANANATTLKWSGVLNKKYIGGGGLTVRFYDNFNDVSGPYTSDITNVVFTIHEANSQYLFPQFDVGEINSGNSGVTTVLPVSGLAGNYLIYVITADFIGTGGAQAAWSNSMTSELSDGAGTIFKSTSIANEGAQTNSNATTLTWTGTLTTEYIGGDDLSIRFFDNFNDASGPYTSDITNVKVEIFETNAPTDYPVVNPGTLTSGTSGITTALDVSGVVDDHLFYVVMADFVGTGGAQAAWSNSIQMELNNGATTIYKNLSGANLGAMTNADPTTLVWTGSLNELYVGGTSLSIRFFDNFHDVSGPYTSSITNVQVRTYPIANAVLPIELIAFEAKLNKASTAVELFWLTASEMNNNYFTIERSADGITWETVERVEAIGNSISLQSYSAIDRNPIQGVSYYRLKQTDLDGSFSYSDKRHIQLYNKEVEIYPNPSKALFNVSIQRQTGTATAHDIIIYDYLGRAITHIVQYEDQFVLNLSDYADGIYFISIDSNEYQKILKQ